MSVFSRNRRQEKQRSWIRKFSNSFRGIARAVRTDSSFAVHLAIAVAVIVAAFVFRLSPIEWCAVVAAIGMVIAAELFNTAIESLARAIDSGHHPRLRDALDISSGAVLLCAASAAAIGLIVFGNRLGNRMGWW